MIFEYAGTSSETWTEEMRAAWNPPTNQQVGFALKLLRRRGLRTIRTSDGSVMKVRAFVRTNSFSEIALLIDRLLDAERQSLAKRGR